MYDGTPGTHQVSGHAIPCVLTVFLVKSLRMSQAHVKNGSCSLVGLIGTCDHAGPYAHVEISQMRKVRPRQSRSQLQGGSAIEVSLIGLPHSSDTCRSKPERSCVLDQIGPSIKIYMNLPLPDEPTSFGLILC